MADIIIAVSVAAITVLSAFLGVRVTFHPVDQSNVKTRRLYKTAFWTLGIVGLILVAIQAKRSADGQTALSDALTKIGARVSTIGARVDTIKSDNERPINVNVQLPRIEQPQHQSSAKSADAKSNTETSERVPQVGPEKKAELAFSFIENGILPSTTGPPLRDISVKSIGNKVSFSFTMVNFSEVSAKQGSVWLRIPENSTFDKEPDRFAAVTNTYTWERVRDFQQLFPGSALSPSQVTITIPDGTSSVGVGLNYACETCVVKANWQFGTIKILR